MTYFALLSKTDMRTSALGTPGAKCMVPPQAGASKECASPEQAAPCHPAVIVILAPLLGVCLWAALIYATL